MSTALQTIRQARADGIRPEVQLTVSEWADAHRRLPKKSSAEPGPWRTDRTPYLRELMDCLSTTSEVEEIVFMKAAQVGGSEAILNAIGYVIDHSPGPAMIIQPTEGLAKRFSRQRLEPLIIVTPRVAAKVAPAWQRDSGNTILGKDFPGGQLILTGANSAVGLRSMPAQYVFMDEIDGYPVDVDEEGSPIELVEARQRTFARRKRAKVSTPTIAGRSAIEAAYEASDQRRYYVPCPDCGEMQPLEFARLQWSKLGLRPEKAVYECRACDYHIRDHEKTEMLAKGEWRAEKPEHAGKTRGYHLNALYAPVGWMSWGDIATQFVASHLDPEKFRVFINTVLGEVWTSKGEAPAWEALQRRRETYPIGTVPKGALFLTAGVDVQKDRVVYEVVGWGRGKRSWSVDYGEIAGDTADLDNGPWSQVDEMLARTFKHESGLTMPIRMLAVDSGYNTHAVYDWAKKYPMNRVLAVKGVEGSGVLIGTPTKVEITDRGRKLRRGGQVWPVSVSVAKSELYGWLRLEPPADGVEPPPGFCHFPQYGDEYFKQLTAEQLVAHKTRKGFIKLEWQLIPGRQNHALDCRIYARAAAALAGIDRFTESDWATREKMLGVIPPAPPVAGDHAAQRNEPQTPVPAAPKPMAPKGWLGPRRNSWLKGR
jgi:phage terminase large subunit GpA-like protein